MKNHQSRKNFKKVAFLGALIFFVTMVGVIFFVDNYKKNKIAEEYLAQEAKNFSDVVDLINELSLEKMFDRPLNDLQVSTRRIENERDKAEKVLEEIGEAQDGNEQRKMNDRVFEVDAFVDDFYRDLETGIKEYISFLTYQIESNNVALNFSREDKALGEKEYDKKTEKMEDKIELLRKVVDNISNLSPPEGLKDEVRRKSGLLSERAEILEKQMVALENKNQAAYQEATEEHDEYWDDYDKEMEKVSDITKAYFGFLGDNFSTLNRKAVKLREMFIFKKTELEIRISNIEIEVW